MTWDARRRRRVGAVGRAGSASARTRACGRPGCRSASAPTASGVRKTVYGASKAEVGEKLRKLQAEHDAGRLVDAEEITTGEYLQPR